jgi:hypothetical protein
VERIEKTDTLSQRTAYRGGAVVFGVPFLGVGTFFAGAGFGYWPLPGKANAPLWVIGYVGLAFALAGLVMMISGVRGLLAKRRGGARLWTEDGMHDRAGGRVLSGFFASVFFAVFLVPFNWWAYLSGQGPFMVKGIVGLFDLILLLVVGQFLYRIAQFLKYGHSRLHFHGYPFRPGGEVAVTFLPNRFDELKATWRFVEERFETTGSGKNRTTSLVSYAHFSETETLAPGRTSPEVDLSFTLPDEPEWVTDVTGQPVRYWELVVEADVPGVDFHATFPLPVVSTAETQKRRNGSPARTGV